MYLSRFSIRVTGDLSLVIYGFGGEVRAVGARRALRGALRYHSRWPFRHGVAAST
jgi:hypothetical protein